MHYVSIFFFPLTFAIFRSLHLSIRHTYIYIVRPHLLLVAYFYDAKETCTRTHDNLQPLKFYAFLNIYLQLFYFNLFYFLILLFFFFFLLLHFHLLKFFICYYYFKVTSKRYFYSHRRKVQRSRYLITRVLY